MDISHEIDVARKSWEKISKDPVFKYKVKNVNQSKLFIPEWEDGLGNKFKVEKDLRDYIVLSVDGSQIYPDRHAGTFCYLINIGSVAINYSNIGHELGPRVSLNSEPYVFGDFKFDEFVDSPTELVNCIRQEYEFDAGYNLAKSYKDRFYGQFENFNLPMAFLFDGSIIFWHLEAKAEQAKKYFLAKYLQIMNRFYEENILMAGFISLTKSKELLNLIRLDLCNFNPENSADYKVVDCICDATIASFYLQEYERSIIFKNNSKITEYYPQHLKPHFFYMNLGFEIVRIEIPAWIAQDEEKVNLVAKIALDQSIKGMGYPVAIAESHEQAVVKGADREFFYHLIGKAAFERNKKIDISQKSRKKLGMGV